MISISMLPFFLLSRTVEKEKNKAFGLCTMKVLFRTTPKGGTMKTHDPRFDAYARLIIEVGSNVQSGVPVLITAAIEAADFTRLVAKYAYEAGASEVVVDWQDDALRRLRLEHASLGVLDNVPDFLYDKREYYCQKGVHMIHLLSSDPEALAGVDADRVQRASMAVNKKFKPLRHYTMNDEVSWCIAAVPCAVWARKVYPDATDDKDAVNRLWEQIFTVMRLNEEDPVAAWQAHLTRLQERANRLNHYRFEQMHYRAENGTDLVVRLPKGHIWCAATSTDNRGTAFVPNMPTEEVFTMPHREGVDGTLVATRPLAYNGSLIEDFTLHFTEGAVTSYSAKKGEEKLKALLEEDENAVRLGEIALVPYDSPISLSHTLFYETLFDENASCHFAFGASYPTTMEEGEKMSEEELKAHGANVSQIHEDFMVGTRDLSITGITADGEEKVVFANGNFVLE